MINYSTDNRCLIASSSYILPHLSQVINVHYAETLAIKTFQVKLTLYY